MPPTPEQEAIIKEEKLAIMSTVRRNGGAQLTPVNYVYKDGRILVSTTRDRMKYHNVKRNPLVSLCIVRAEGRPYVTVYGKARIEEDDIVEGTAEIFKTLSGRELPDNFEEGLRQQKRILIIVEPERFAP
ncbi:MAG: TIGR03618 family F420-dependent PPOX class oxidoreductase [Dehalococcoidia bacterium]